MNWAALNFTLKGLMMNNFYIWKATEVLFLVLVMSFYYNFII